MKEQPQSLESQLKLARPRRAEVKRVPLTPEEKKFLGKIMDKAVAAERAGKLAEALGFYTDYRDELLKIKKKKEEDNIVWTKEKLEKLVKKLYGKPKGKRTIAEMTNEIFDLSRLPKLETLEDLDFNYLVIDEFPANITVYGDLNLDVAEVVKWVGSGLVVKGDMNMADAIIDYLPENTYIEGFLIMNNSSIKDLPDDLFVGRAIILHGCDKKVIEKAEKLKAEGKIIGDIALVE